MADSLAPWRCTAERNSPPKISVMGDSEKEVCFSMHVDTLHSSITVRNNIIFHSTTTRSLKSKCEFDVPKTTHGAGYNKQPAPRTVRDCSSCRIYTLNMKDNKTEHVFSGQQNTCCQQVQTRLKLFSYLSCDSGLVLWANLFPLFILVFSIGCLGYTFTWWLNRWRA